MIELAPAIEVKLPSRHWLPERADSKRSALVTLCELGTVFKKGAEALGGLYLRICDTVRKYELTPEEVRFTLSAVGWSKVRISEVMRVAYAPQKVYNEFSARLIGFKVALSKTRLYYMAGRGKLRYKRRQLQRAAVRLVKRLEENGLREWSFACREWRISGQLETVCYIPSGRPSNPPSEVELHSVTDRPFPPAGAASDSGGFGTSPGRAEVLASLPPAGDVAEDASPRASGRAVRARTPKPSGRALTANPPKHSGKEAA